MKGIILSGGTGSRLFPLTVVTNKQLLPINRKPIIDYSINTLIKLGCKEITVIVGGDHFKQPKLYLKNGPDKGVKFKFIRQDSANGVAAAVNLCESSFNREEQFAICLGDNLFQTPVKFDMSIKNAKIALYDTPEIKRFGCASIKNGKIIGIEEKPKVLRTDCDANLAITGLYIFDYRFFEYFKQIKPSARGEWEITEIINKYLENDLLDYTLVEDTWLDCGTFETIEMARALEKEKNLEKDLI